MNEPAPPRRSAAQFFLNQLDQAGYEAVIKDCAKQGAKDFRAKREALLPALHLRNPPPEERLAEFRNRPDTTWSLLRQIFPERYKQQTADWHALEEKVRRGEMTPPAPEVQPDPPLPPPLPNIVESGSPAQTERAQGRFEAQAAREGFPDTRIPGN